MLTFLLKELTRRRNVITSLAGGLVLGTAIDHFTIQTTGWPVNTGTILGEIGGPTIYATLWGLSERHARQKTNFSS